MIVWLASYPKSGNTLLRSLISSYFFTDDGTFNFNILKNIPKFPSHDLFKDQGIDLSNELEVIKNYIPVQNKINEKNSNKTIRFLKTHSSFFKINNFNFSNVQNTLGAIYIIRDPRDVAISFANHMSLSLDEATKRVIFESGLNNIKFNIKTYVGSWGFNYNSWKKIGNKKLLLLKYEDLISKKEEIIKQVLFFLEDLTNSQFQIDEKKIKNIINSTSFQRMQEIEEKEGFFEAPVDNKTGRIKKFFKKGIDGNWKKNLDLKNKNLIEDKFSKEMKELNYL